jgi:cupin 2 domain-containing protein
VTGSAHNLFAPLTGEHRGEVAGVLAEGEAVRVERIVSLGDASPPGFWYDQDEEEWVAVLLGGARLALRDPEEELSLGPGDHVTIRAHRPHRVEWTAPGEATVWLAVFYRSSA